MAFETIPKIEDSQLSERSVTKLADRPNLVGQYGHSGMTANQLKAWFDKLALFLAARINDITGTFQKDTAANYIRVCLDEYNVQSLGDLVTAFQNGTFAEKVLLVAKHDGSQGKESLQIVLNEFARLISTNKFAVEQIEDDIVNLEREVNYIKENGVGSSSSVVVATQGQPTFTVENGGLYVYIPEGSNNPYELGEDGNLYMVVPMVTEEESE